MGTLCFGIMGNGESKGNQRYTVDGETLTLSEIESLVVQLKRQVSVKDLKIDQYAVELAEAMRVGEEAERDKVRLQHEVDKLRSVLEKKATTTTTTTTAGMTPHSPKSARDMPCPSESVDQNHPHALVNNYMKRNLLDAGGGGGGGGAGELTPLDPNSGKNLVSKTQATLGMLFQHVSRTKKQGVSAESADLIAPKGGKPVHELVRHPKDSVAKMFIRDAIRDNDFLTHLEDAQVNELVDCMHEESFKASKTVITEGTPGLNLYVIAGGDLEVRRGDKSLGVLSAGKVFGELAILYNCTRTASVVALTDAVLWAIDRKSFQTIMMKTAMERQSERLQFLTQVPLFRDLDLAVLSKIANCLEVDTFSKGECIVREGAVGDNFYIISKGEVVVTQSVAGSNVPVEVRRLERGAYFGEKALIHQDVRTANVIAAHNVECLSLDREHFLTFIGNLDELKSRDYGDRERGASASHPPSAIFKTPQINGLSAKVSRTSSHDNEYESVSLGELEPVATLGVGGFGRVELVRLNQNHKLTFALKSLKKQHVVDTRQQEHVICEKEILRKINSPFIIRLYKTFKDNKYVYMLMEVCLGGELWSILRDKGHFDEQTTRFYVGCVIEALAYLHKRTIVYRDLKPENLLVDSEGYVKLCDFGFAKKVPNGSKTYTFCGTPEYVSPEIILNKGHDHASDFWSLGILVYELFTGAPPFSGQNPMKTYNLILKGIDHIQFQPIIPRSAQNLIKRLCRTNPSERIGNAKDGILDIKRHKWYQGFDWTGLTTRNISPPFVPNIKGPGDHNNFDSYPKDNEIPPDELSGWDANF